MSIQLHVDQLHWLINNKTILNNISFDVSKGEVIVLSAQMVRVKLAYCVVLLINSKVLKLQSYLAQSILKIKESAIILLKN